MSLLTTPKNSADPALEAALAGVAEEVLSASKADGQAVLPKLTGDTLSVYLDPLMYKYQELIDKEAEDGKPQATKQAAVSNRQTAQATIQDLHNKKRELETKANQSAAALQNTPEPEKLKRKQWAWVPMICAGVIDAALMVDLFIKWGSGNLEARILAPFYAVLFAFMSHVIPWAIGKLPTEKLQKAAVIITCIAFCICFYMLGVERAEFITETTGHHTSSLPFTVLSILLFAASIIISAKYLPSEEERREIRNYKKIAKKAEVTRKEFEAVEKQIAEIQNTKVTVEASAVEQYELRLNRVNRIKTAARLAVSVYVNTNRRYRPDQEIPDCFNQPYEFAFINPFEPKHEANENA